MSEPRTPSEVERFMPGQVLAGRYRIIERVGAGGMGEVYRADDLKLGQPVALKFLSRELSTDPALLLSLIEEVKLARQVSHPNVCRVHDIGELDGLHFLSMEFVDGEDLASLLRRIGRLPGDKARQVALEIAAGLAAIHERGVLHRDLKPANIMIDGRGRARITDFGLAQRQADRGDSELLIGTPLYMAPECIHGGDSLTVRSDLYSFGLVLYELFTGKRPFEGATVTDIFRAKLESTPVAPSRVQSDIDPAAERAILRCIERDPARRPRSAEALTVLLAPGDPIAAAIAAGQTPTPELIAARSSAEAGVRPALAAVLLGTLAAGLALLLAVAPHTRLLAYLPLPEPPDVMAARARASLLEQGFSRMPVDRAGGFEFDEAAIDRVVTSDPSATRWRSLAGIRPAVVTFWHRESEEPMNAPSPWFRISYSDPAWTDGMAGVRLDAHGAIEQLNAPPTARATPAEPTDPSRRATSLVLHGMRPALSLAALLIGAWLARRNLRAGRGDTKRALRWATSMFSIRLLVWLLAGHLTIGTLTGQLVTTLAWSLYDAAYAWVFYVAIEPYVRRLWPRLLVSWTRFVDGRFLDARVGRDLLIGCVVGTVIALAVAAHQAAPALFGLPPGRPDNVGYVENQLASLLGLRIQLGELLLMARSNAVLMMGFVVLLVMSRLLLRHPVAAVLAVGALFVPLALPRGELAALNVGFAIATTALLLTTMFRFGLLAGGTAMITHAILEAAPLGPPLDTWPANRVLLVVGLVFVVGVFGFGRALGGRSAIRDPLAEP